MTIDTKSQGKKQSTGVFLVSLLWFIFVVKGKCIGKVPSIIPLYRLDTSKETFIYDVGKVKSIKNDKI